MENKLKMPYEKCIGVMYLEMVYSLYSLQGREDTVIQLDQVEEDQGVEVEVEVEEEEVMEEEIEAEIEIEEEVTIAGIGIEEAVVHLEEVDIKEVVLTVVLIETLLQVVTLKEVIYVIIVINLAISQEIVRTNP
jgi:hypothetical protein